MPCNTMHFLKREMWALSFLVVSIIAVIPAALSGQAQQSASGQAAAQTSEMPKGKSFSSPEDAAAALFAAALRNDEAGLLLILGPGGKEIIEWSDDPNQRQAQRQQFAQKYEQMHRLAKEPDNTVALYVGAENWPLPIPLIEYNGAWYFDAELGKQEIRYRRIGRNEVEALQVCHALADAEKEYHADAHHYTDKFVSSANSHDGLYWSSSDPKQNSPIGPYLAHAGVGPSESAGRVPYHGYYYRILLQANAGEFAIVAFPAEYRSSGVMTFLMNANGDAYEKDLGPATAASSKQITSFNPDNTWKKVE